MRATTGSEGVLDARFDASLCGKTRLTAGYCKFPLHFTPVMYLDEHVPGMAFLYTQNPTGGIYGGDRLNVRIVATEGARIHVTTTGATKLHRTSCGEAQEEIDVQIGKMAYVEFVPEPLIPYSGSDFRQHLRVDMADTATFVATEIVFPGRVWRGEAFSYSRLKLQLDVVSGGQPLCSDALMLEPAVWAPSRRGVLGPNCYVATVYAISPGCDANTLNEQVQQAIAGLSHPVAGSGKLPFDAGVFIKILARSSLSVRHAVAAVFGAVRRELLGSPLAPRSCRSESRC